jgi:short-subunit dehydrogenase
MSSPTAIIIGASSGIGAELAHQLAAKGYRLGIAARRKELLDQHAAKLPQVKCVRRMDISQPEEALKVFGEMLQELGEVDAIYLVSGLGHLNPELRWDYEAETIRVNALGFAALAGSAWKFFLKQGRGHLIGITSVAAVRAAATTPAYGSSKIFCSHYLQALRLRAIKSRLPIHVTEIRPGFVDTAMGRHDRAFWVAPVPVAVRQILRAVERKKRVAYVTRRWYFVAGLFRLLPEWLLARLT